MNQLNTRILMSKWSSKRLKNKTRNQQIRNSKKMRDNLKNLKSYNKMKRDSKKCLFKKNPLKKMMQTCLRLNRQQKTILENKINHSCRVSL